MSFTLMIFLLAFLPAYLIFHTLVPSTRGKNIVLLVFSCLFYAYGGIPCLLLLLADALLGFQAGRLLEKTHHKRYLVLPIIVWLGLLGVFKYAGFFGKNIGALFGDPLMVHLALPMGISFYTFKLISYLADVWQDRCPAEKSPLSFLCYVTTFHQVLQGPIVRYPDMREALHERTVNREAMISGLVRFSTGLFKKAVLADYCGTLADTLLPLDGSIGTVPKAGLWIGSVLFTMQIYLDFSAYSDMAIALGTMSGFTCPENFNYPYAAVSVKDFWRRWHISLSSFFRDYVYFPLGGSRVSPVRTVLNLLIVWLLTGFWHGADWNFILWGLYYFAFVVLENFIRKRKLQQADASVRDLAGKTPSAGAASAPSRSTVARILKEFPARLYTLFVVNLGWVIFRFTNFKELGTVLSGLFTGAAAGGTSAFVGMTVKNNIFFLLFALLCCSPLFLRLGQAIRKRYEAGRLSAGAWYGLRLALTLLCFVLALTAIAGSTFRPFLYNTF